MINSLLLFAFSFFFYPVLLFSMEPTRRIHIQGSISGPKWSIKWERERAKHRSGFSFAHMYVCSACYLNVFDRYMYICTCSFLPFCPIKSSLDSFFVFYTTYDSSNIRKILVIKLIWSLYWHYVYTSIHTSSICNSLTFWYLHRL